MNSFTQTSTVEQVDALLIEAIQSRASDLHFEPFPSHAQIRLRIDGLMTQARLLPLNVYYSLLARIKTLSGLDIAQQRIPQDGRLAYCYNQKTTQFRVHTCATIHGEKLVLRLIQGMDEVLTIETLGLLPEQLACLTQLLNVNHGLIIVCGPTGSGKTMTLYTLLQALATRQLEIITLEDPVEIALPGISQLQVHRKQQLDFSSLLRACLRQDPDVILVGEIRDEETAHIAVRAALTGHLVLTSLHTPHAQASLARLRNMGIASYDLEECLQAVIAQRLVRTLIDDQFQGRTGIFEIYQPNQPGLNLAQVGHQKVLMGLTTASELRRVL